MQDHFSSSRYHEIITSSRWDFTLPQQRYGGLGLDWSIYNLAKTDTMAIQVLYAKMKSLMDLDVWDCNDPIVQCEALIQWSMDHEWKLCWRNVAAIGPETYAKVGPDPILRRVIHDLRGGPMTSLVLTIGLLENKRRVDPQYICLLARDVRKIIRNCFPDIDPDLYNHDVQNKKHSVRLISEKWGRLQSNHNNNVRVHLEFEGYIANSCVEFSAIDRVLYNIMNNALRESAHHTSFVDLLVATDPRAEEAEHVLFWVENTISMDQKKALIHRFDDHYDDLFLTNYSTTGSGIGLQIVADFVSKAYGVTTKRALNMGVFGARRIQNRFAVWFYWPAAD